MHTRGMNNFTPHYKERPQEGKTTRYKRLGAVVGIIYNNSSNCLLSVRDLYLRWECAVCRLSYRAVLFLPHCLKGKWSRAALHGWLNKRLQGV